MVSLLEFHHGDVLAETHQRIEKVNFSHSGIISCVVELVGGGAIETGMIANDGEFGASQRPKNCVAPKCRNRWAVSGSTAGLLYVSLTRQIVVWPTHCGLGGFAMTTGALAALILCVEVFLLSFAAIAVFWFADWWRRGIGPQHKDYAKGKEHKSSLQWVTPGHR